MGLLDDTTFPGGFGPWNAFYPSPLQAGDPATAVPLPQPRPRVQNAVLRADPNAGLRADPIADIINPARQLNNVQRLLNEFGYGPIKVSGTLDGSTKEGIERFERDHNLPVTGQNSPRLRQALSAATGRPVE